MFKLYFWIRKGFLKQKSQKLYVDLKPDMQENYAFVICSGYFTMIYIS